MKEKVMITFPLRIYRRASHSLHEELILILNCIFFIRICKDWAEPLFFVIIDSDSHTKGRTKQISHVKTPFTESDTMTKMYNKINKFLHLLEKNEYEKQTTQIWN